MNIIACDGDWSVGPSGSPVCIGTLTSITSDSIIPPGMTTEDAAELSQHSIALFAVVFVGLVLRRALK